MMRRGARNESGYLLFVFDYGGDCGRDLAHDLVRKETQPFPESLNRYTPHLERIDGRGLLETVYIVRFQAHVPEVPCK
jgi:hypothetical protein